QRRLPALSPAGFSRARDPSRGTRLPKYLAVSRMAIQTYPISADGLAVHAMIGLNGRDAANIVAAGLPVPAPILASALIDTGSDVTCCASTILQRLGLAPIQQYTTQTVSGSLSVRLFEVSFSIPGASSASGPLLVLPQLVVMELAQPLVNVDVLIGL